MARHAKRVEVVLEGDKEIADHLERVTGKRWTAKMVRVRRARPSSDNRLMHLVRRGRVLVKATTVERWWRAECEGAP